MKMNLDQVLIELTARSRQLKPIQDKYELFARATGTMETPGLCSKPQRVGRGELQDVGAYNFNNGTLAFVDKCLDIYIGRNSAETIKALTDAGYVEGNMYVPHSNDCGRGREKLLS